MQLSLVITFHVNAVSVSSVLWRFRITDNYSQDVSEILKIMILIALELNNHDTFFVHVIAIFIKSFTFTLLGSGKGFYRWLNLSGSPQIQFLKNIRELTPQFCLVFRSPKWFWYVERHSKFSLINGKANYRRQIICWVRAAKCLQTIRKLKVWHSMNNYTSTFILIP